LKEWSVAEMAGLLRHSRNTRSQDNLYRRIIRSNPRSEHEPVDATSEVDIRKQYLDRFSTSENRLRLFTGPRLQNAVSAVAKKIAPRQANEMRVPKPPALTAEVFYVESGVKKSMIVALTWLQAEQLGRPT
jgi:hypothetical protein